DETAMARDQMTRLRSAVDDKTGLYGAPARYYDQNLALFGIGAVEREFWFDVNGGLHTRWKPERQSVLRKAISAARSAGGRSSPKACPLTARVVTPAPRNPVGT